ncbi:MAG TPA: DUF1795 domain-containing protein [Firmicutes bacterium]|nr:DUF1795 domain-containing protein [Bacillota bacterium]
MSKNKIITCTVLSLLVLGLAGFVYEDPTGLYTTVIPKQWIYQAHHSTDSLIVFYGAGDLDLLYIEQLSHVFDEDAHSFAQRSLATYASLGGLPDFEIEEPPTAIDIGGRPGVFAAYSYQGAEKERLLEYRIFLLLPNERALTITFSDGADLIGQSGAILDEIVKNWRWAL